MGINMNIEDEIKALSNKLTEIHPEYDNSVSIDYDGVDTWWVLAGNRNENCSMQEGCSIYIGTGLTLESAIKEIKQFIGIKS